MSSQATSTATIYAAITIPRRLELNVLVQFLVHVFRTTSFYPLLAMSVRHGEAASHCLQTANADLLQLCRFRRSPVAPYHCNLSRRSLLSKGHDSGRLSRRSYIISTHSLICQAFWTMEFKDGAFKLFRWLECCRFVRSYISAVNLQRIQRSLIPLQ